MLEPPLVKLSIELSKKLYKCTRRLRTIDEEEVVVKEEVVVIVVEEHFPGFKVFLCLLTR
jgi:hypothetical protein